MNQTMMFGPSWLRCILSRGRDSLFIRMKNQSHLQNQKTDTKSGKLRAGCQCITQDIMKCLRNMECLINSLSWREWWIADLPHLESKGLLHLIKMIKLSMHIMESWPKFLTSWTTLMTWSWRIPMMLNHTESPLNDYRFIFLDGSDEVFDQVHGEILRN